ncbi:ATP-binding cassette domain-containing protein [Brucella sp. BE17]|uniref:ATP-binding cassette domain-containing protein n=1 Tax=Brucella sp. BE17 TaxID=3142977 RepID=UPI0031BAEFF1
MNCKRAVSMPNIGLFDAACYPLPAQKLERTQIIEALTGVGLEHLVETGCEAGRLSSTLSGGEMQRLALARAILIRPDWLFIDEATSALDKASEIELLDLLRRKLPDTTVVILAHRQPGNLFIDDVIDLEAFGVAKKQSDRIALQTA